jgi:hypothetical protein
MHRDSRAAGKWGGLAVCLAKNGLPLAVGLLLVSCWAKEITRLQMVGSYHAVLDSGRDIIALDSDGTFTEELTFRNGKKISNRGNWSVQGSALSLEGILAVGPDSPSPNGYVPKTSVVLPISQLFGRVRSFGVEEWAVFEKK